jgi:hypothetical protein
MEFVETLPGQSQKTPPAVKVGAKQSFEPMQFASSSIILPQSCYRVFKAPRDYVEVNAGSAYEAMQKSGVMSPVKIMRFSLNQMNILTQELLTQNEAAEQALQSAIEEGKLEADTQEVSPVEAEAVTDSEEEPAPEKEMKEITEEKAMTEGLEGDEVDQLLNESEAPEGE